MSKYKKDWSCVVVERALYVASKEKASENQYVCVCVWKDIRIPPETVNPCEMMIQTDQSKKAREKEIR